MTTKHEKLWQALRQYTEARIGLGHSSGSILTKDHLAFQYAHACAQDAVRRALNWQTVIDGLQKAQLDVLRVHSQAADREEYLQRPDLGRVLDSHSLEAVAGLAKKIDVMLVIADGLSSTAIEQNALAMTKQLTKELTKHGLACPYVCLAEQARVALGDHIAELTGARHLVVLIGERPGLSSPNSLGLYYSWSAKQGFTDAQRNCISNIRDGGQSVVSATQRAMWLIKQAEKRKISGVMLKDESQAQSITLNKTPENFLIPLKD